MKQVLVLCVLACVLVLCRASVGEHLKFTQVRLPLSIFVPQRAETRPLQPPRDTHIHAILLQIVSHVLKLELHQRTRVLCESLFSTTSDASFLFIRVVSGLD